MSCERKSNLKRAFDNQVSDLHSNQDPSLEAGASSSPKDEWVECSKCQKWRLICVGHVKAESLSQNWECREMTWLPGFNNCEVSEEITTISGYKLLGVPAQNINFDILNGNGYHRVATSPAVLTNGSLHPMDLVKRTQEMKCCLEGMGTTRECKLMRRNHQAHEASIRVNIKLRRTDNTNGRSLYRPRCSNFGSPIASPLLGEKTNLKARAVETAWKDRYCGHKGNGVRSERRCRLEATTRTPRDKVVTDEPRCSKSGSLSKSWLNTNFKAHTGENVRAWKDGYHTHTPGLSERRPEGATKLRMQEADDYELPSKGSGQKALTIEVPTEETIPPKNTDVLREGATEVPTKERRWEDVEVQMKERRQLVINREIQINNSFRSEEADFCVMNSRVEAAAFIKPAADCRKCMPHMEDERPIADLYLQAGLKYLQTARYQEILYGESQELKDLDICYLNSYMDGAEMLEDCTKIYEKVSDHGKAALCHILSGVARMRLLNVIMQTSPTDLEKLYRTASMYSCQQKENSETYKQTEEGYRCSASSVAHSSNEPGTSSSQNHSHMEPTLRTELPLGSNPKTTTSVLVPSSLHSTYKRFLQNSSNISPMLDSWIKARNCLALAEASRGDSKNTKLLVEVRKVCELAMFDDFEKLISQVYVAIKAFST